MASVFPSRSLQANMKAAAGLTYKGKYDLDAAALLDLFAQGVPVKLSDEEPNAPYSYFESAKGALARGHVFHAVKMMDLALSHSNGTQAGASEMRLYMSAHSLFLADLIKTVEALPKEGPALPPGQDVSGLCPTPRPSPLFRKDSDKSLFINELISLKGEETPAVPGTKEDALSLALNVAQ